MSVSAVELGEIGFGLLFILCPLIMNSEVLYTFEWFNTDLIDLTGVLLESVSCL
jgi:hypothetical protein